MAFSGDKSNPPLRFRPAPGQLGQSAAMQLQRPGQGKGGGRKAQQGQSKESGAAASPLGLPGKIEQESNNNHLTAAMRYENIKRLGREVPFGLWAVHSGEFARLAPPGMAPHDWLEDA